MIPRYRLNYAHEDDAVMLADQAGRWVKVDDVAFGLSISADEERLLRLIRTGDFQGARALLESARKARRAADRAAGL